MFPQLHLEKMVARAATVGHTRFFNSRKRQSQKICAITLKRRILYVHEQRHSEIEGNQNDQRAS